MFCPFLKGLNGAIMCICGVKPWGGALCHFHSSSSTCTHGQDSEQHLHHREDVLLHPCEELQWWELSVLTFSARLQPVVMVPGTAKGKFISISKEKIKVVSVIIYMFSWHISTFVVFSKFKLTNIIKPGFHVIVIIREKKKRPIFSNRKDDFKHYLFLTSTLSNKLRWAIKDNL